MASTLRPAITHEPQEHSRNATLKIHKPSGRATALNKNSEMWKMENMKTWKIENLSNALFGLKELTLDLANLNYIRESQFQLPGLSALSLL
jgi:hypothetical protein